MIILWPSTGQLDIIYGSNSLYCHTKLFPHRDLMFDCWRNNLYGGLKAVERQLGIERRLKDVNGYEAIRLWWKYVDTFDLEALNKLLDDYLTE